MGAHKDRMIMAADLLGMTPDDLLTLLDSRHATRPAGSNAPEEDGPHSFEPRDHDEARRHGLSVAGCDYCGQVAADPIHGTGSDDEPWPADSPEGQDVAAMRARDDAR